MTAPTTMSQATTTENRVSVEQVRSMFENMLAGWACDWLRLMARGLDIPVCDGRSIRRDVQMHADESPTLDRVGAASCSLRDRLSASGDSTGWRRAA